MIRIITDSASDITILEGRKLGIEVIPLEVRFENEVYYDGDTLTKKDFYTMLEQCKELPKTSQINPYRFESVYEQITNDGDEAIVICLSSKLSGTYQSAVIAKAGYDNIYVVDSNTAAIGERLLITYALKLIEEKKNIKEIVDILNYKKKLIHVIAKLDTLKYLRKGGRISGLVAFAGETLNIKPIIGVIDGSVKMLGKGRGLSHANKVLTKLIGLYGGIDETMPFGTVYSGNDDSMLRKYIENCEDLLVTGAKIDVYCLGCTIGTHIGPNALGVAFFLRI